MPRKASIALVLFTVSLLAGACTRNDATGPSDSSHPSLSETQGARN